MKNEIIINPFKLRLCYNFIIKKNDFNEEPLFNLISNFKEIKTIINSNDTNILKFLFINRKRIESILYNEEQYIKLESNILGNSFSNYFYLVLLIDNNDVMVNYIYSFALIKEINKAKTNEKEILKKIIFSKIIIELISNYIRSDIYDGSEENQLNNIKNENTKIIEDNLSIFKELNLNLTMDDIRKKKIDEIYIDIIIALIQSKKFENKEYIKNTFELLDLKNIIMTEKMLEKLSNFVNTEYFKNNYNISSFDDLINDNKIFFYKILFEYLLKKQINTFNIDPLNKIGLNTINIIKSNITKFDSEQIDKKKDILKIFTNNNHLIIKKNIKQEIIKKAKDIISNSIFKIHLYAGEVYYDEIKVGDLTYEDLNKLQEEFAIIKEVDKLKTIFVKFWDVHKGIMNRICAGFKNRYKLKIALQFIAQENMDKGNFYNIDCIYSFTSPINESIIKKYKDSDILNKDLQEGIEYLLIEINDDEYKNIQ